MKIRINDTRAAAIIVAAGLLSLLQTGNVDAQVSAQSAIEDTLHLSVSEARRLAITKNPAFLADAEGRGIAQGSLRQARTYRFNPQLDVELPSAQQTERGYLVQLSQELEVAGQRGLRIDAAEFGVERATAAVGNSARIAVAEASLSFYSALADRRRLMVAEEIQQLNDELLVAVRIQLREGEINRLEGNFAQVEAARAQARVLAARRAAAESELRLKRLVGVAPETPIRLVADELPTPIDPDRLRPDSLLAAAINDRPDLTERGAAVRQSMTLTRLARREAVPNPRVGVLLEREDVRGDRRLGVGLALPLPIWNRNQGLIAEREAEARRAQFELTATELRVRTEVLGALRAYTAAFEEAQVYETGVLAPARESQRMLETAFRAGRVDLPSLLLQRNQLLEAELGYWDAWLASRRALVELQAATGAINDDTNDAR